MKMPIAMCATVLATACVATPSAEKAISIDIVQGRNAHLWGVSAMRAPEGAKVVGFAANSQNEHLHAEAINDEGQVLQFIPVPWSSAPSLRSRKSASFQTSFGPQSSSLTRVRLSLAPGTLHKEGG